jgi:hypothetical protein
MEMSIGNSGLEPPGWVKQVAIRNPIPAEVSRSPGGRQPHCNPANAVVKSFYRLLTSTGAVAIFSIGAGPSAH